jgi:integrase
MSVYRPNASQEFYVDREFLMDGQLVRIKEKLWTTAKRIAHAREELLIEVHRAGAFDLLRAVKVGEITVLDLVNAKRERRLYVADALREITDRRNLWDVLESCIALGTAGDSTKERYRLSVKKLRRSGVLGEGATIRSLDLVVWPALKLQWEGSAADWNHLRRMLSHCLTIYYGDVYAPQRRALVKKIPRAAEPRSRLAMLSLPLFQKMMFKVADDVRPAYWTLLVTAMRAGEDGEYFSCGPQHLDRSEYLIHVPGEKTEGSAATIAVHQDDWHWVERGIPAPRQYQALRRSWKKAARAVGHPSLRLHDIRHLSIRLALEGGASVADAQAHARHEDPTMTLDYARIESSRRAADAIRRAITEGDR